MRKVAEHSITIPRCWATASRLCRNHRRGHSPHLQDWPPLRSPPPNPWHPGRTVRIRQPDQPRHGVREGSVPTIRNTAVITEAGSIGLHHDSRGTCRAFRSCGSWDPWVALIPLRTCWSLGSRRTRLTPGSWFTGCARRPGCAHWSYWTLETRCSRITLGTLCPRYSYGTLGSLRPDHGNKSSRSACRFGSIEMRLSRIDIKVAPLAQ